MPPGGNRRAVVAHAPLSLKGSVVSDSSHGNARPGPRPCSRTVLRHFVRPARGQFLARVRAQAARHGHSRVADTGLIARDPQRNPNYTVVTSVSGRIIRRCVSDSAPTHAPGGTPTTFPTVMRENSAHDAGPRNQKTPPKRGDPKHEPKRQLRSKGARTTKHPHADLRGQPQGLASG